MDASQVVYLDTRGLLGLQVLLDGLHVVLYVREHSACDVGQAGHLVEPKTHDAMTHLDVSSVRRSIEGGLLKTVRQDNVNACRVRARKAVYRSRSWSPRPPHRHPPQTRCHQ